VAHRHQPGPRGERTRARILEAATELFAEKGYSDARLEDVASRVGVQRAALVYYFRDKRQLYEAVLREGTSDLLERFESIFAAADPPRERIEAMVHAWVDVITERPWLARLMLREVAGATASREPRFAPRGRRVLELTEAVLEEGRKSGAFQPVDALHLASAVGGTTVFFVSVIPTIAPRGSFDPLSPDQLAKHRRELLSVARRLLGTERAAKPARRRRR
jgi:AcrR family transcriptional regulator